MSKFILDIVNNGANPINHSNLYLQPRKKPFERQKTRNLIKF